MAVITDDPPADVTRMLDALRVDLDGPGGIPQKVIDHNLVIGTWNIRAFGDITERWHSREGDTPRRDWTAVRAIAEILRRFDVVAVQEVRDNIRGLRRVLSVLGPEWGLILTDTTKGKAGNDERLAFIYDTRRVKPSGLACELVLPETASGAPARQFARTPYAVSFVADGDTFILTTMHVVYGKAPKDRIEELTEIADWLAEWARREHDWGQNLLALGDFNIDRGDDPLYRAFTSTGLTPAPELNSVRRTIFDDPEANHHYDQIAWFTGGDGVPELELAYTGRAGGYDFTKTVETKLNPIELSWRISDHYPLWVEFAR